MVATNQGASGIVDGIEVKTCSVQNLSLFRNWAELVITQTAASKNAAMQFRNRVPLAYINHDPNFLNAELPRNCGPVLTVFNSEYGANKFPDIFPSVVVLPPVFPERYATQKGDRITLVNINKNKGGDIFWQLVNKMPNHKFLAVEGGYGQQIKPRVIPNNVELVKHTSDMKKIYSQTRIVIMPSIIETFGRVAIEAAASGIPTICTPTDGLKEALGDSGIYVASRNVNDWATALLSLDDPKIYDEASSKALMRSHELHPQKNINELNDALLGLRNNFLIKTAQS